MSRINDAAIDAMAEMWDEEGFSTPPNEIANYKPFRPKLNPIQGECFDGIQTHIFNLLYGERYSGKSYGGVHALVEHCRENVNARALIVVLTGRQGEEGGVWAKLNMGIRVEWETGGNAVFTEPKTNKYKDVFIWISNKFGGWSRVVLLSMPVEGFVIDRIKGMEPTFVLVDEAQGLKSATYFDNIVQQLGRDVNIKHQPIVFCCNPDGPSHWLYKRFFEDSMDPITGKPNPDYFVRHVPFTDNKHNAPKDYIRRVEEACKNNDTMRRRMLLGEWVDMPSGEALFKDDFKEERHVKGNAFKNSGIIPIRTAPMIGSWDLGSAHSSLHFEQVIPTKEKIFWLVLDEFNYVDQYVSYKKLVPTVIERMRYWEERAGGAMQWIHISDNSAFNQYRAKEGSFDYLDIRNISRAYVEEKGYPERFVINMLACPKAPHSVEARVRGLKEKLQDDGIIVSATCLKTIEMMRKLEEDPDDKLTPKRSRWLHPFDSLTYAQHYFKARNRSVIPDPTSSTPQVYSATP